MDDDIEFLTALAHGLPDDERLILCGFAGDPETAGPSAWKPRPWRPGREQPMPKAIWNGYVTVGSFRRAGDGSFRRRNETFASGLALMVDDVGTKVARETVADVEPTWIIETSPGNEQWWYMLTAPETDVAKFDGVIRAFISGKLLGADPGMSGVTRVGRIPGFQNDKPKYGGWVVRTLKANGPRRTLAELLAAFALTINGRREIRPKLTSVEAIERNRMFMSVHKFLDQRNMLKRHEPDPSGWTEMTCPWVDDHTGSADTGAAIREPAGENDYYGAFRCHHGHCINKGWADVTEWVNELAVEELERAAS